ncbi:hypothetical protein J7E87_29210 [Streptomyces sp. ISL-1]|uniref:hypothetical protein n=1 Tax=Streptomyces sp. ISL-1 TaxID=2817657 RepID=UPI001BE575BA|nr:hypothetical protein [Streptomyces sp. ISL-1]MBT2393389.1 hypothetical protein [Streptomyces sp. ISL-1]
MTITVHAQTADAAAPAQPAYDPMPSIPRLLTELVAEEFWTGYATVRGDAGTFHPDYLADRKRTALLLRAVIADLVALVDPANTHHAAQAAAAANALRRADWQMLLPAEAARTWLRGQYERHTEDDDPHPPNCLGGCRGSGWVIEPVIWQNDGVPVHAEPVTCLRGEEDDPHADDCTGCRGSGKKYDAEHREYTVCGAYTPDPAYEPAPRPAASDDPWSSSPPGGYDDEPPF